MNFIASTLKGIIIGMGAILPGISSGVLCVIFGIYDKLVNSVLGLFKNFKENFKFLFPIAIGGIIGFLLFGNILNYLFTTYNSECKSLFLGFIIGGLPSLFKTANKSSNFKPHYILFTFCSFALGFFLIILEKNINVSSFASQNSFLYLFISGIAMSAGIIVPGVSSTVILMCFGVYYTYLEAISSLNMVFLIPLSLGVVFGSFVFLIFIRYMLNKFPSQTFYTIIGFVLGSTFIIIPQNINMLTILLFLLGISITYGIENK